MKAGNIEVLGTKVLEELQKLDKFNYDVASYRLQNGMSPQLKALYKQMGCYHAMLEQAKEQAVNINGLFEQIYLKEDNNECKKN